MNLLLLWIRVYDKEYFADIYFFMGPDVTFDISKNAMKVHEEFAEPWKK